MYKGHSHEHDHEAHEGQKSRMSGSDHNHTHGSVAEKELGLAIGVTSFILLAEVLGGVFSNSLALLSDAGHVLSDLLALGLSWFAIRLASRPASLSRTFGLHRSEIFVALINGIGLMGISIWIYHEAYTRILLPEAVKTREMMSIALIGLAGNLWVVKKLHGFTSNLSVRSAFLHALGDAISSMGVVVGGLAIVVTGRYIVDVIVGLIIGTIIIVGAIRLVRESTHILMEGTPLHLNLDDAKRAILNVPGVVAVKDLHVWSICSDINAASAHVVVADMKISDLNDMTRDIQDVLSAMNIHHTTLQFVAEAGT